MPIFPVKPIVLAVATVNHHTDNFYDTAFRSFTAANNAIFNNPAVTPEEVLAALGEEAVARVKAMLAFQDVLNTIKPDTIPEDKKVRAEIVGDQVVVKPRV